jgi:uncharacterized protein YacL
MDYILFIMLAVVLYVLLTQHESIKISGMKNLGRARRSIILDSCTLIDGRIVDLVRTGFVADELVIPKFILSELQMLADGNDSHKRERARFGLEVAAELQEYVWAKVTIDESQIPGTVATDDKLVKLAKKRKGVLCTTDYNLNKVAAVEGIKTLNVNELAQALRPVTLPGEDIQVKIIQRGSNQDQGVGYLEDGTMIVVDGAARFIGSTISVGVDRMHQTVAGKMVFAHFKQHSIKPSRSANKQQPEPRTVSDTHKSRSNRTLPSKLRLKKKSVRQI